MALIARAEVSWEEQNGTSHDALARIEDKSPSGACIRVNMPIGVGSKVKIKWQREEFSGIAKYCRSEAGQYVSGIQRITKETGHNRVNARQEPTIKAVAPVSGALAPIVVKQVEEKVIDLPETNVQPKTAPIVNSPILPALAPMATVSQEIVSEDYLLTLKSPKLDAPTGAAPKTQPPPIHKGRTKMSTKWLDTAFRRQKQDMPNENTGSTTVPPNSTEPATSARTNGNAGARDLAKFHGELQTMEDIYRAAGIMNPRYSVSKVADMLNSEHIRGLSNDAKRAAVLMALDAAGVSFDEVLRDAKVRQDALDTYEANQRKHFEDYWANKDEGNAQIHAELERVTSQYLELIKRNLDEVSLEKTAFSKWQAVKQQEAGRISEARDLCSKPTPGPEPPSSSGPVLRPTGVTVQPS